MKNWKIKKPRSLTVFVIFSISIVILYSIINIVSKYHDVDISDTLTTCVYAFFGGEVVSCALIKIFKLRESEEEHTPAIGFNVTHEMEDM